MSELAMDKLRDEMAATQDDGVRMIGEYMTVRTTNTPEIADKVLAEGKTLKGAFAEMRTYASNHKSGNYAFVPPDKAMEIVDKYYGIPHDPQALAEMYGVAQADTSSGQRAGGLRGVSVTRPQSAEARDALDLDALLGGL